MIAKAPIERLQAFAQERGWKHMRLLSSAHNTFNHDYHAEFEDRQQAPMVGVFRRDTDGIRHCWSSEMLFADPDPGQDPRHAGTIEPLWTLMDLTPIGRPDFKSRSNIGATADPAGYRSARMAIKLLANRRVAGPVKKVATHRLGPHWSRIPPPGATAGRLLPSHTPAFWTALQMPPSAISGSVAAACLLTHVALRPRGQSPASRQLRTTPHVSNSSARSRSRLQPFYAAMYPPRAWAQAAVVSGSRRISCLPTDLVRSGQSTMTRSPPSSARHNFRAKQLPLPTGPPGQVGLSGACSGAPPDRGEAPLVILIPRGYWGPTIHSRPGHRV